MDGNNLRIWRLVPLYGVMVPNIIRLDSPIYDKSQRPHSLILDEPSFVELVINNTLSRKELQKLGVSSHVMYASFRLYKDKYYDELMLSKAKKISKSQKERKRLTKDKPEVVLDSKVLCGLLEKGYSVFRIAKELNTTEWFVRRNLEYYNLATYTKLPGRFLDQDQEYLDTLELFSPGLKDACYTYYSNPEAFFDKLYKAHTKVQELSWFIKDLASSYSYYRESGKVSKNHICWSSNASEIKLSLVLLENGIEHIRQYPLFKNFMLDFYLPKYKLGVEIDGEYHSQEDTRIRDDKKNQLCQEKGITLMRFTTKEIKENIPKCITKIQNFISEK